MPRKRKAVSPEEARIMRYFGQQIGRARESRGLSQAELGRLVGVSGAMISAIEQGVSNTTSTKVAKIAEVLGLSIDSLYPPRTTDPIRAMQHRLVELPPDMAQTMDAFLENILRHLSPSPREC